MIKIQVILCIILNLHICIVVFTEIKQGISLKQVLPPYFSYAVAEVSCVEKQSHENWKVEPKKSVPFSEKETNPEIKISYLWYKFLILKQ